MVRLKLLSKKKKIKKKEIFNQCGYSCQLAVNLVMISPMKDHREYETTNLTQTKNMNIVDQFGQRQRSVDS